MSRTVAMLRYDETSIDLYFVPVTDIMIYHHYQCTALVNTLGAAAFYNEEPVGFREGYFCQQQQEVAPACVIQPGSAEDVSKLSRSSISMNAYSRSGVEDMECFLELPMRTKGSLSTCVI
jgi:hypothetical protein